jgi:hypothetical protein
MAFAAVGVGGSTGASGLNNSSVVLTLNGQAGSGAALDELCVLTVGVHNFSSVSNADEGAVTGVVDDGTNTRNVWTKAREITNGNAASTAGMVCSVWYARINTPLTTANTLTASLSQSAARDSKTACMYRFTAPGAVKVFDSTYVTVVSSVISSFDLAGPSNGHLRFRALAARSTFTSLTPTATWSTVPSKVSGSASVQNGLHGEFLITSATTANSAPLLNTTITKIQASVYVIFEEDQLLGDGTG